MCGIVGVFGNKTYEVNSELLTKMRDEMIHRGPDGAGLWVSENKRVGFGHRRLSILDLTESAAQPMSNQDGKVIITYNGEVYNFQEIKKELQDFDYKWKTDHSDTEVILHAYEQWGIKFIHKLRGQFAFAIWDRNINKLYLVRDKMGIKPLYYTFQEDKLVFASEIKAIIKDKTIKREVNEEAFYHYLSFLTTPAPMTLFQGINKIPAGTYLEVSLSDNLENFDVNTVKYYYPGMNDSSKPMNGNTDEKKIIEDLQMRLRDSVNSHKVSDVPSGVFLSGGIDSSLNAALFSESEKKPVKTFTITYDDKEANYKSEAPFARIVSDQIKSDHYEHELTVEDMISFMDRMIYLQDEPIADPVCVPVYYVSKLAKDNNVTVCHVGEGADEVFLGYPDWKKNIDYNNSNNKKYKRIFQKGLLQVAKILGKDKSTRYEWLRRAANGEDVFWGGAEIFTETQKESLLSNRLKSKYKNLSSWQIIKKYKADFEKTNLEKSRLNWMGYLDLNLRLPELLLMRVDKMSMGVSIETRVPFLDYKLVEYGMSIPESIRSKNGTLKYILKKASESIIPNEIIYREKQGFGVPLNDWFQEKLGDYAKTVITEFIEQTDFFDKETIIKMIENKDHQLWYILNFALWWNKFIKQN